ncbi:saccharopine dehydrogenase family protein [Brevibacillus borstelensis]|uniref:saccharopine dehydrogenase family protein n=1 Tax=Brevibacillus borstelensis TaxID=45462 RepID=UPI0030C4C1A8
MKDKIVVVGGYGHVGKTICQELGKRHPGKVYAAGRSLDSAVRFCQTTGGAVLPLRLDSKGVFDESFFLDVKLVVMCLDQSDPAFVKFCFANGIHYVDISADYSFLKQVENMRAEAEKGGTTAVLSVGLAPGLTNLLALEAKRHVDWLDSVDISIMLGLGDRHGEAAIAWTVDNLDSEFTVWQSGTAVSVESFTDGKRTDFGKGIGRRTAYRFNFSDQHVIPHTAGVPTVSTRLCFDSAVVTESLAWLKRMGSFSYLKRKPVRDAIVKSFGTIRFGKELFIVKMDAWGSRGGQDRMIEYMLRGKNEAEMTAYIAAWTANALYCAAFPHGVYHIDQLFDFPMIWPELSAMAALEARASVQGSLDTKRFRN